MPRWRAEDMYPVKILRGDDAEEFTIYAVHTCHLWKGLELVKCAF